MVSLIDCLLEKPTYGANSAAVEYDPELPRYVRITDILDDGRLSNHDPRSLSWDAARGNMLDPGDIIIARSGASVGKSYLHMDGCNFAHAGYLIRFRPDCSIVLPSYLHAVIRSTLFRRWLNGMRREGAQPNVNAKEYGSFRFPLPPLSEQHKVSDALRTWDTEIRKLQALQKAETRRKRGLIVALATGKRRILKFKGRPWATMPLSRVLAESRAKSAGGEEIYSVSVSKGLVNQVEHLGRSYAAANTTNYNRVMPGDIVYTRSPTGDFPLGIIKQSRVPMPVIVSPLYGVFTPATRALGTILDAWFESPIAVGNYLRPLAQKGAKNTISVTNRRFLEGKLHLPLAKPEQNAMAATIEESRAVIRILESQIRAYRRQRRGLAQRLLVGPNGSDACCRGRESP